MLLDFLKGRQSRAIYSLLYIYIHVYITVHISKCTCIYIYIFIYIIYKYLQRGSQCSLIFQGALVSCDLVTLINLYTCIHSHTCIKMYMHIYIYIFLYIYMAHSHLYGLKENGVEGGCGKTVAQPRFFVV